MISKLSYNQLTDLLVNVNSKLDDINLILNPKPKAQPSASPTTNPSESKSAGPMGQAQVVDATSVPVVVSPVVADAEPVAKVVSVQVVSSTFPGEKDNPNAPETKANSLPEDHAAFALAAAIDKIKLDEKVAAAAPGVLEPEVVVKAAEQPQPVLVQPMDVGATEEPNKVEKTEEKGQVEKKSDIIQDDDGEKERLKREKGILEAQQKILMEFLKTSASQLTFCGLSQLHQNLNEGILCVFFRNNHFAVIHKHKEELFLLVTDIAFASLPSVVWEKLSTVDGDTLFTDSRFQVLHNPQAGVDTKVQLRGNGIPTSDEQAALDLARQISAEQAKRDAAYAQSLYQQEIGGGDQKTPPRPVPVATPLTDEEIARRLQAEENTRNNIQAAPAVDVSSQMYAQPPAMTDEQLARQLHEQEIRRAQQARRGGGRSARTQQQQRVRARDGQPGNKKKNCSIQ